MLDDEMQKMKEKSFDKWADLAQSVYELCRSGNNMRKDQIIYYMFHEENWLDEDGQRNIRIKTSGKKLTKISLETKFTIILRSTIIGSGADAQYGFEIKPSIGSPTKVPMDMIKLFPNAQKGEDGMLWIENDLSVVDAAVRAFYEMPADPTPAVDTLVFPELELSGSKWKR
jgi:hypothetical protein